MSFTHPMFTPGCFPVAGLTSPSSRCSPDIAAGPSAAQENRIATETPAKRQKNKRKRERGWSKLSFQILLALTRKRGSVLWNRTGISYMEEAG